MGTNYTNAVWEMNPITGLPPSAWLVFLYLADCANNHTGRCWPSINTIAKRTKIGLKQVRRLVHKLEDFQLIEIVGNRKGGRPGTTLQFRLLVEPRANRNTPPTSGSPLSQPLPSNASLQREPTPPRRHTDASLPVLKTPPAQGSQTIMNLKTNRKEDFQMKNFSQPKSQADWSLSDWAQCGQHLGIDFDPKIYPNVYDYIAKVKELLKRADGSPPPAKPYNLAASKES